MPQVMSDTSKINQLPGMYNRKHSVFSSQEMILPILFSVYTVKTIIFILYRSEKIEHTAIHI